MTSATASVSAPSPAAAAEAPWRFFDVTVRTVTRLSPSFLRFTFTGDDLGSYADLGYDARTKFVLPTTDGYRHLPRTPDWFPVWRTLPERQKNPIRTYTTRAVRPATAEVDVDVVLHGDGGPASRWALAAEPGTPLVLLGPNARAQGPHGGVEFRMPADERPVLLAGDETAVPAITTILEQLPDDATGWAFLEVPEAGDRWPVAAPDGVHLSWLPRAGRAHGELLVPAVQEAAAAACDQRRPGAEPEEVDIENELLWEVPTAAGSGRVSAWFAGEAAVIRTLRRHLVAELGVDRRSVSFMGYWRQGRAEN